MSVPQSNSDDPVEIVIDILQGYSSWTLETPTVKRWEEVAQSERGPGHGQPAELYVLREPTQDHETLDAEGSTVTETGSVTIFTYSLDPAEAYQYNQDVIRLLEEYIRDNYQNTNLHNIEGEESNDYRAEHLTRKTDHFVDSHTVGYRDIRPTGV